MLQQQFAVAWLGHASVLARCGGVNVLVDPVLSERIGYRIAGRTIGPRRLSDAPVHAEALRGAADLLLITHAHFDHLDRPTLRVLADARTTVVVPKGCARLIPKGFCDVVELRAQDTPDVCGLRVESMEPNHRGERHAWDRHRKALSYVVRWDAGGALFAGDTAMTHAFDALQGLDLAVFGIGAYNPRTHAHATPEQAWAMFKACGATKLLPVHHSTFHMSDEPMDEPMQRLIAAAGEERARVVEAELGETKALGTGH
ncbi:MAG: MBL fold metallo-hydrolase [Phycisphaerales bacterium]|nr:MBL fold metallo-hydrolase [Phycisphaerales bacterium]